MSDHPCIQEKTIIRIEKELFGNGKDGLIHIVPGLSSNIDHLSKDIDGLRTAISGFTKFMTESTAIRIYKEKESLSARQRMTIIISAIIGLSGIIVSVIIELL